MRPSQFPVTAQLQFDIFAPFLKTSAAPGGEKKIPTSAGRSETPKVSLYLINFNYFNKPN
jgi:hypothetical protein